MKYLSNHKAVSIVIILLITLVMGGCGGVKVHKALDSELMIHTDNARVLSAIPKEEISIHFQAKVYTSGGGGLLWALIDKGINKKRSSTVEERIAPLLEATADVDFHTQYWNKLEKVLADSPWFKVERLDKRMLGYDKEEMAEVKTPFLVLNTSYELSTNSQVLIVQTKANFYITDLKKPDYFGFYTYYSDKVTGNGETEEEAIDNWSSNNTENGEADEEAIEHWSSNNAEAYRNALVEGIDQNMYMMQIDLLNMPTNLEMETDEDIRMRIRSPLSGAMQTFQGKLISRENNRVIMREKGGNVFSIATGLEEE